MILTEEQTFHRYKLYKHKDNIDVAILPIDLDVAKDGSFILVVYWFLSNEHRTINTNIKDEIIIKKEDIVNWKLVV